MFLKIHKAFNSVQDGFLRIELQIFSLHWMMQNIRLFNVCEAQRATMRH